MVGYGEFDFIDSIRELFASMPDNGFEGIGDDCSVLPIGGGEALLFTSDMLNEGVHFLADRSSAYQVGYKSVMVNISDVAAMGARPVATLLSLALPEERFGEWSAEFMEGYHDASKRYGVKLVGGDTTSSQSGISISVTAIGRARRTNIKRRSAAKVGDVVMVTGALGGSAAGLRDVLAGRLGTRNAKRHLSPEARVAEGEWLGLQREVHAMADISDGLASDMQHILDESRVGAVLVEVDIPVARGATLEEALGGGEDYELLFTVSKDRADALTQRFESQFGRRLYNIGRVVRAEGDECRLGLQGDVGVMYSSAGWGGYSHF